MAFHLQSVGHNFECWYRRIVSVEHNVLEWLNRLSLNIMIPVRALSVRSFPKTLLSKSIPNGEITNYFLYLLFTKNKVLQPKTKTFAYIPSSLIRGGGRIKKTNFLSGFAARIQFFNEQ